MENSINESKFTESRFQKLGKALAIGALVGLFSACSPEKKSDFWSKRQQHYEEKEAFFSGKREYQARTYENVAIQENKQQDFKDAGIKDPILDEEIGYSHDFTDELNRKISSSTKEKARAQKRASKAGENASGYAKQAEKAEKRQKHLKHRDSNYERLDTKTHHWIIEEESHN